MKVGNYRVVFKHLKDTRTSECDIYDNDCKNDDKCVAIGEAKLYHKDTFDQDKGRRVTLHRALQKLFPNSADGSHKQKRNQFWEAYRTMTKQPRWT